MKAAQFKDLCQGFKLTPRQWSVILGCTDRAVRKWQDGSNAVPRFVIGFFRLLAMLPARKRRPALLELLELSQ